MTLNFSPDCGLCFVIDDHHRQLKHNNFKSTDKSKITSAILNWLLEIEALMNMGKLSSCSRGLSPLQLFVIFDQLPHSGMTESVKTGQN